MKRKSFRGFAPLASALSLIVLSGHSLAAIRTKADNATTLDQGTSWGGTAPTAADTANWSGTYNTAGSLAATLPAAALTWGGITVGNLAGTAAGTLSIGGTAAAPTGSILSIGTGGINLTSANQNVVLNAETLKADASQTWRVAATRNLRLGAVALTGNLDGTGGNNTVITVAGGGTLDANQGATNGFADFTGKWIVEAGTTLRGAQNGTSAWGSNASADAILLRGGILAVGGITGSGGNWTWSTPITLAAGTTSILSGQHVDTTTRTLNLQGAIAGDGNLVFEKTSGGTFRVSVDREDNPFTGTVTINGIGAGVAANNLTVQASVGTGDGTKTPLGVGTISVNNGATLEFRTAATTGAFITVANNLNLASSTLLVRDGFQSFTGLISVAGACTLQGAVDGKHSTFEGLIQDGAAPGSLTLRSLGAQQIILPNANTYTGGTTLGTGTTNAGIVVLGNTAALGTGPISARGAQIQADEPGFAISNAVNVGAGGLCTGGANDITFASTVTVDNASRPFQNYGTADTTLLGIDLSSGTSAMASFGTTAVKGNFNVLGRITGTGKVEVKGGTLTLAAANTYTGSTAISGAGRLNLTGSLTSNITLTGSLAYLMGGGSTTGNLNTSGTNGGNILIDPNTPGQTITVSGTVTLGGPTKVELASAQPPGTTNYPVLRYGTLAAGSIEKLSSSIGRATFTDDAANKRIMMALSTAQRTWNRATSTTWNLTDANWAEGDNKFVNGDTAVFSDAGAGTVTLSGLLNPYDTRFTNSAGNDYTLVSTANNQLTGAGTLTKSGSGTVTLTGENKHSGRTNLNGGILAIAADNSLGTLPASPVADQLVLDGGSLRITPPAAANFTLPANRGITLASNGGTLDLSNLGNNAVSGYVAGAISGNGPLTLAANGSTSDTGDGVPGALLLTGANTFTGPVTITKGVVAMTSSFGAEDNPIVLDGGGIVDQNTNVTFNHPIQIGAAGGILRSYQSASTTFTASVSNAPGVASATVTHTDGGIQYFTGDGSNFTGNYVNARGSVYFDSNSWQGLNLVNVDGDPARFRGIGLTRVNSITTDRDVFISADTILDVVSGQITVGTGTTPQNFWIQDGGVLTSSSGTLNLNYPVPYEGGGVTDQAVRVIIADPLDGPPLTVVKNGPGAVSYFDGANTYTGGTVVNAGRIDVASGISLGTGPVTVKSGGQVYLTANGATYYNDFTIEGNGPTENAGNLGALRFQETTIQGNLTIAPAGARIVGYLGNGGTIAGTLGGTGNLELNSATGNHNGTIRILADGSGYAATTTLAQGTLELAGTLGGTINLANSTTLRGEGTSTGTLTLGAGNGATLAIDGSSAEALTTNTLVTSGPCNVRLDVLPDPVAPITILNYTTLTGSLADFRNAPTTLRRLAFTDTGTSITAVIDSGTRTWTGATSANWDSSSLNWEEGDKRFFTGDTAVFTDAATVKAVNVVGTVTPAAVEFNNSTSNDYTVTGRIVTPTDGKVVKNGTGNVTLAGGPSSPGGLVEINNGRLILANTDYTRALGASPGVVINNGGTLRLRGTNLLYDGGGGTPVTVNEGGTVELDAYHSHFKELTLNGGTIIGMRSDADTRYNNEYSTFDSPVIVGGTRRSVITRIAGGAGTFSIAANVSFDVGDVTAGTDLLVSAPFVGTILNKDGLGTMEITAACAHTGGTNINAGTFLANNLAGSATGNGSVVVKTSATLGGNGTISGPVTIETGATLAPGVGIESLATGALTMADGTTLTAEIDTAGTTATADVLIISGNVTVGGTLTLTDLASTPRVVKGGTKLTLMTYTGALTGTFTGLPEGSTVNVGVNSFKLRYNDDKKITLESLATAVDDFTSWSDSYGVTASGPNGDDDKDGLTNREEYAFGLHPKNPSSANAVTAPVNKTSGMFTYVRRKPSLTGLTYKVWTSTNLTTWTEDPAAIQTPTAVGENESVAVTLSAPKPLTALKLFVRITAE